MACKARRLRWRLHQRQRPRKELLILKAGKADYALGRLWKSSYAAFFAFEFTCQIDQCLRLAEGIGGITSQVGFAY